VAFVIPRIPVIALRAVRDRVVGGSNPLAPTNPLNQLRYHVSRHLRLLRSDRSCSVAVLGPEASDRSSNRLPGLFGRRDVVAVKHFPSPVPGDLHSHDLRNADRIRFRIAERLKVMEQESQSASSIAGRCPSLAPVSERSAFPVKHERGESSALSRLESPKSLTGRRSPYAELSAA
jgi:hypothetical protein